MYLSLDLRHGHGTLGRVDVLAAMNAGPSGASYLVCDRSEVRR
jgi:hypothetical protein